MTETKRILKSYLISVIITVLTTIIFCGIFIAQTNTDKMLFGSKNVAIKVFEVYNLIVLYMKGCIRVFIRIMNL